MPISQILNFQALTPEQANPQRGRLQAMLANYIQASQAANAPAMNQAQVAQAQNQARYFGSEAGLNNEKTNWYGRDIGSQIGERNASAQKSLADAMMTRKDIPWEDRLNQAKINAFNMGGRGGMGVGGKEQSLFQSLVAKDNPDLTPDEAYEASNVLAGGGTQLKNGKQLNELSPAASASLDRITKYGSTAQGLNQQRFANTTDKLLDYGKQYIPSISKYSGALGKTTGSMDAVKNSLGQDTPDYNKYIYFTRRFVPTAASEMMRAFGVNASDTQKDLYLKVNNPIAWDQDPKGVMESYNRLQEMFRQTIGSTVGKSISQIKSDLNKGLHNKSNQDNDPLGIL